MEFRAKGYNFEMMYEIRLQQSGDNEKKNILREQYKLFHADEVKYLKLSSVHFALFSSILYRCFLRR